jgi:heme exporter protein D
MRITWSGVAAAFLVLLVGCAKPVRQEKASYVGEWSGTAMGLLT